MDSRRGRPSKRWIGRCLVVVVVGSLSAVGLIPRSTSPAQANVISITPFNESGEPTDTFRDDEAIWALVRSGLGGGEICVIPAQGSAW